MTKHTPYKVTGEIEEIEINIVRGLMRLASEGELTLSKHPCTLQLNARLVMRGNPSKPWYGKELTVSSKGDRRDTTMVISPVADCICKLLDQVKELRK